MSQTAAYFHARYVANRDRVKEQHRQWKAKNPEHNKRLQREWRRANPDVGRNLHWKAYGIFNSDGSSFTTADYNAAYALQRGCCKICGRHSSGFKRRLSADHDHTTKIFRGLLCAACNTKLGHYEAKEFREKAERYLLGGK